MLREIDLIRLLMSYHQEWESNPEAFLEMTILISSIDCRCMDSGEVNLEHIMGPKLDNVAKVFMSITHINLAPYKDFIDLKKNGHPTTFFSERLVDVLETIEQSNPNEDVEKIINQREGNVEHYFQDKASEKLFVKLWPYITPVED